MSQKPKLSVTGYRAIWGKDLDEQIAFEYVRAFAKFTTEKSKGKEKVRVLIGRDARQTGPLIFNSAKEALKKENIEVTYAGIIPTPSMLLLTRKLSFDGGIMITASHNPPEYNGVKFIMPNGMLTNQQQTDEIEEKRLRLTEQEKTPSLEEKIFTENNANEEFRRIHMQEVLKNIDVELIKSKKFKVCLDSINSAGSIITQELLNELGCEVHIINGTPDGNFAHKPEPLEANLTETLKFMRETEHDIGFVQDPDADRLVLVDEKGNFILEELMVTLCIKSFLSRAEEKGRENNVVVNLSTTRVVEDVANEYGATLHRVKVGEANVAEKMISAGAKIGGEGSGGIIYPNVGFFRDSLSGIGLMLELLARDGRKISEIVASLPKYENKKQNLHFAGDLSLVYKKLEEKFTDATVNTLDGIRFDWPDEAWIHIRPSNTEPILRIFGEAKTRERIEALFKDVESAL